ncbi:MAG TPA: radical SAM protein [Candidatus Binatia bacterium]|nr:radical SAM protein [Candidatus Binatia bacterium]
MAAPRALLINPPTGNYIRDDRCQVPADAISSSLRAPIDLLYYATILQERGYACEVRDYPALGLGRDAWLADLARLRPAIVVASVTTPTLREDLRCIEDAKAAAPDCLTVAKGAHFVVADREAMESCPALDVAVRGEAESAVMEIADGARMEDVLGVTWRKDGAVVRNAPRPQVRDLDFLPKPDRRLLDNRLYVRPDSGRPQTTILASRGCPKDCIFCLVKVVTGRPISERSPKSIVDEVEACVRDHGIRDFYFRADTFTWHKAWVTEICDLILARGLDVHWVCNSRADTVNDAMLAKMKAAGCWMIGLGIESGSAEILRRIKKGITKDEARASARLIRKHGIRTYNFFIIGFPWDDEATIKETVDFAIELDSDFVEFHTAYPFLGTEYHDIAVKEGLFEPARLHGADVMTSPARTRTLSSGRLHELRLAALRRYYLRPSRILRTLRHVDSPAMLMNYARKGMRVLSGV